MNGIESGSVFPRHLYDSIDDRLIELLRHHLGFFGPCHAPAFGIDLFAA